MSERDRIAASPSVVLRRVNWLTNTVQYEWVEASGFVRGKPFTATLQEWDRAYD